MDTQYKKVLIVRFSSIGDIVLTSPVVRCVKKQLGNKVHFITKSKFRSTLEHNPHIDKIYTIDKEITEILHQLKDEKYDLIIDLHKNLRSKRLIMGLGVKSISFDKINIENSSWTNYTGTNIPAAASGLRLTSRDLLNFGLVYLNDGKWANEQILPSFWANESLKTAILHRDSEELMGGYGYQFWTWKQPIEGDTIHMADADGNGGQKIMIDKINQILIIITAGNYNNWALENDSYSIFEKIYEDFK